MNGSTSRGLAPRDPTLKANAFFLALESEKAANPVETVVDARRLRLVLESGGRFVVSETATLRPSLELGLRHDGGDAGRTRRNGGDDHGGLAEPGERRGAMSARAGWIAAALAAPLPGPRGVRD